MQPHSLNERLQRLGAHAPVPSAAIARPPADPKLTELLVRIARLKGRARPSPVEVTESSLAARLDGEMLAPGVILVERSYPLWHKIGRVSLATLMQARGATFADDPRRCLFLDTETTGLAGGSATVAFMVGIGRLQPTAARTPAFVMRQYLICGFGGEGAMLDALANEVHDGDCLVTFNGKSYDLPLLATRYRLQGRPNPLSGLAHLDLRHPLRRIYHRKFPDCRLKTLEEQLLGHRRDHDLPGSEAPGAWLDWLKRREMSKLAEVARHNRGDVLAMAGLCHFLATRETADLVP